MEALAGRDRSQTAPQMLTAPGERRIVGGGEIEAHYPEQGVQEPVRLEFVVRPPLGAGPRPGSGRPNGHCSARHGPPMWPPAKVNSVWSFNDAWLRTSWSEARRQAPRNGASSLDAARVLGIRDAQAYWPSVRTTHRRCRRCPHRACGDRRGDPGARELCHDGALQHR